MAKIVSQHQITFPHGFLSAGAILTVPKGSKVLSTKWNRWSIQLSILEDVDVKETEVREFIVAQPGYMIPTHNDQGFLIRVLEHVGSVDVPNSEEQLHIFENTKR